MISPTRSTDRNSEPETEHPVPFFTQAGTFTDCWPDINRHLNEMFDRGKYSHGRRSPNWKRHSPNTPEHAMSWR